MGYIVQILWDILGKHYEIYLAKLLNILGRNYGIYFAKPMGCIGKK